ncbi:FHIPEP family protein, partial [Vibrio parahaemolyticus V-223/04]
YYLYPRSYWICSSPLTSL